MKEKICKALGNNIKYYRKLKGFTQETLAEAVGLEVKSLSLIETGKGFVSANSLANLSQTLQVSPSQLFEMPDKNEEKELYENALKHLELIKSAPGKLRILNYVLKGLE